MVKQHDNVYEEQRNWNAWEIFYFKKLKKINDDEHLPSKKALMSSRGIHLAVGEKMVPLLHSVLKTGII